jgi:Dyp-type peroxidase family
MTPSVTSDLDLHDIQGNIVKAYSRAGFPKARYVFLRVNDGEAGRNLVLDLLPAITTSAPWAVHGSSADGTARPEVAINVAFTFEGLMRLGVPQASLQTFPEEFAMGMRARRAILGDDGPSSPEHWDPVWTAPDPVHIFVAINGGDMAHIIKAYQRVLGLCDKHRSGVEILAGHRGDTGQEALPYQDASAIYVNGEVTPTEHFGYVDGISNPFFRGALTDYSNVIGGGKVTGGNVETTDGWAPLETGEFLLGYRDEAFEYPEAPIPAPLAMNGTYLAYRKLHENVGSFDAYLEHVGREFPGGKEALAAKFAGRWRTGAPITTFGTEREATEFAEDWAAAKLAIGRARNPAEREQAKRRFSALNAKFVAFDYSEDQSGGRCPFGAHTRRVHPRSALEFGVEGAFETPDALANRRRILRRGLPYGDSHGERKDDGNHGIIFMALGASLRRQFEFVQQQWINYGNDFRLASEKDPLLGNHGVDSLGHGKGRMVIESDPNDSRPPFFCSKLPRFVETRGGDYFFVPSLTALRMIGDGIVDPT